MLNYAEFIELANKVFCKLQANDSSSHIYYAWRRMSGNIEYCCNESQVISLDDLCDIYWRGECAFAMIENCENWYKTYVYTIGSRDSKYLDVERDYMRNCLIAHSLNNTECERPTFKTSQIALMLSLVDDNTRDRLLTTDPIGVLLARWFFDDTNTIIRRIIGEPDCYEILCYGEK